MMRNQQEESKASASSTAVAEKRASLHSAVATSPAAPDPLQRAVVARTSSLSPTNGKRSELTSPTSNSSGKQNRNASPLLFWLLLVVGCFQIVLYHPNMGSQQDIDHWFDRDSWKVAIHLSKQSNRKPTTAQGRSTPKSSTSSATTAAAAASDQLMGVVDSADATNSLKSTSLQELQNETTTSIEESRTKNPILQVLLAAGLTNIDGKELESLPTLDTLHRLYGPLKEPVAIGMETCAAYRNRVPPKERVVAVAGMFNTGTNAMAFHLRSNIHVENAWQVPWGKHRMEFVRLNHTAVGLEDINQTNVLPVVLIRDPFYWMQSMCKSPYAAHWRYRHGHCPNLVPDETDVKTLWRLTDSGYHDTFRVTVKFDKQQEFTWDSLVHLWNDWYRLYVQAEYPRLMFRFEDLLLHGPSIMKRIAECAGVTVPPEFKFQTGSAKNHGSHTTFLDAIKKTGDLQARLKQLTPADLNFAGQHLDKDLMRMFRYDLPTSSATT